MTNMALRRINIGLVCLFSMLGFTAGLNCLVSSSVDQFQEYVGSFPACRISEEADRFQDEVQIFNQVFDDNGQFNKNGFKPDVLQTFCSNIQNCKSQVSSCENKLNDFVQSVGTALCQGGTAMTQVIENALNVLDKTSCDPFAEPKVGGSPDGCYLNENDYVGPTTYLGSVTRENKKSSAADRCLNRFTFAQGGCSVEALAAYATITAASQPLQNIGSNFNSYTSFQKPAMSVDQTSLALRGFSHLYKGATRTDTCSGLPSDVTLLWNTYIRIDASLETLEPMAEKKLLSTVRIQFSDDTGITLDTYSTGMTTGTGADIKPGLSQHTGLTRDGLASKIEIEVKNDNLVVLTHYDINTKIAVSKGSRGLSIVVSMPTSLIDLETLGLLVEGCTTYSATSITNLEAESTSDCRTQCSTIESTYADQCSYDCTYGAEQPTIIYKDIETENDLVVGIYTTPIPSTATQTMLSLLLTVTMATVHFLL